MTTYTYIVRCPNCVDEFFEFFKEAEAYALGKLSEKPIITQTEVERNDFGECTNHCDLGTVWSWEDVMGKETDAEPTVSVFTKDDLKRMADCEDPEFDNIDNSVDFEIDEDSISTVGDAIEFLVKDEEEAIAGYEKVEDRIKAFDAENEEEILDTIDHIKAEEEEHIEELEALSDNKVEATHERKPIPEGMTFEELVEAMEENEDTVECTKCGNLVEKASCHHNKEGFGWCCSTCEPADTLVEEPEEPYDLGNTHEGSYPEIRTWICYYNGDDLGTVEAATEEEAYLKMEKTWPEYRYNNEDVQVIPADELEESASKVDTLEEAVDYRKRLASCPECGTENSFDHETGLCLGCGFII